MVSIRAIALGAAITAAISGVSGYSAPASAQCAYVAVHTPYDTPAVSPGPAGSPCFDFAQRCGSAFGCFKGQLRLGRDFIRGSVPPKKRLDARFGYIDPSGMHWDVPAGYVTDGATIPPGLKPIVGSSWHHSYIRAAVIHDYYIDYAKLTVAAAAVHRVFFHALLASGVQPYWAHFMYRAVAEFGPQWRPLIWRTTNGSGSTMFASRPNSTGHSSSATRSVCSSVNRSSGARH